MSRAEDRGWAVVLVPSDPSWPDRFEREREAILDAFDPRGVERTGVRVEHIGSTAVPGLAAKPILDLMLGAERLEQVEARIERLEALGYVYVPEHEAVLPNRRFLRKSRGEARTHHLHCVALDSDFWRDHLAFRDALRADRESAAEYEGLKRKLAARHPNDRNAYTDGKSDFVASVLARRRPPGTT